MYGRKLLTYLEIFLIKSIPNSKQIFFSKEDIGIEDLGLVFSGPSESCDRLFWMDERYTKDAEMKSGKIAGASYYFREKLP